MKGIETDHATVVCDDSNDQDQNMNPYPPVELWRVWFTDHALEQFHDRYSTKVSRSFKPITLLSWAEEDRAISAESSQKRLMRHDNEKARYFSFERWRFVVVEIGEILSVVTFEKKNISMNPKKRWSRRNKRRNKGRKRQRKRRDAITW